MRILLPSLPFASASAKNDAPPWIKPTPVACRWISHPGDPAAPFVTAFRNMFRLETDKTIMIHVAADERYELYLDGIRIGRGNDRGDRSAWYFDTYKLQLEPGEHILAARTWSLGKISPWSQISIKSGFILAPDDVEDHSWLGTGVAQWETAALDGYTFQEVGSLGIGTGAKVKIDGQLFPWSYAQRDSCDRRLAWQPAAKGEHWNDGSTGFVSPDEHLMTPSILQASVSRPVSDIRVRHVDAAAREGIKNISQPIEAANHLSGEADDWQQLLQGHPLSIPPHTARRIIFDLQNYYCIYPALLVSEGRGSLLRCSWTEKLYNNPEGRQYGNRNEIDGKYFTGVGDEFICDGGTHRKFDTLWWHAGRYMQLEIRTQDEPLRLEQIELEETRYPLEPAGSFSTGEGWLDTVLTKSLRTLQMCAHETFMDCPYWEQLMYIGDTRVESLITYAVSSDDALPRKGIQLFENSRLHPAALIACSAPQTNTKIIPSFIFWWVGMVYDFAMYRNDLDFVSGRMPVVRDMLDRLCRLRQQDGLLTAPPGWNYMDVASSHSEWRYGIVADDGTGTNAIYNWLAVYTLRIAERLERLVAEPELSSRWSGMANQLQAAIDQVYWIEEVGLYADTHSGQTFSEHAQCLALLSNSLSNSRHQRITQHLFASDHLIKTSIFFSHYYLEVCHLTKREDKFYERLAEWKLLDDEGLMTTPEHWGSTRSDCHAWGAHLLYHFYSSILGIRPVEFHMERISIEPMLGSLRNLSGTMSSPYGAIEVQYTKSDEGALHVRIELPEALSGRFVYEGCNRDLHSGLQTFICD